MRSLYRRFGLCFAPTAVRALVAGLVLATAACKPSTSSGLRDVPNDSPVREKATAEELASVGYMARSKCTVVVVGPRVVLTTTHCQPRPGDHIFSGRAVLAGTAVPDPIVAIIDYDPVLDFSTALLERDLVGSTKVGFLETNPSNITVAGDYTAEATPAPNAAATEPMGDAPTRLDLADPVTPAATATPAGTPDANDPTKDMTPTLAAMFKAAGGPVTRGDAPTDVIVVGYPVDLTPAVGPGVSAYTAKGKTMGYDRNNGLMINAGVAPGNSGGPVYRKGDGNKLDLVAIVIRGRHELDDPEFYNHKSSEKSAWGYVAPIWQIFRQSKFLQAAYATGRYVDGNAMDYLKTHAPTVAGGTAVLDQSDCVRQTRVLAASNAPDGTPIKVTWSDGHVQDCGVLRGGQAVPAAQAPAQGAPPATAGAGAQPATGSLATGSR